MRENVMPLVNSYIDAIRRNEASAVPLQGTFTWYAMKSCSFAVIATLGLC